MQCVISNFRNEVAEKCALMGYYAANSGKNNAHNGGYVKHTSPTHKSVFHENYLVKC